jgi:hypothetical protein
MQANHDNAVLTTVIVGRFLNVVRKPESASGNGIL